MAWQLAAVAAGTAVVGGIIGLGANSKFKRAIAEARRGLSTAQNYRGEAKNHFDDIQKEYGKWFGLYGEIEAGLADFYENLTEEGVRAQGLQGQAKEHQRHKDQIKQISSELGLKGSGYEAEALMTASASNAERNAQIRFEAPYNIAAQKANFFNNTALNRYNQISGREGVATQRLANSESQVLQAHNQVASAYSAQAASQAALGAGLIRAGASLGAASVGLPSSPEQQ